MRFLDAIEGKSVQASDEADNPAPFQHILLSESGAEAATESPGDSVQFQQQAIPAESVTPVAGRCDQETENGFKEQTDLGAKSRIFDAIAPDTADELLATNVTKNLRLFDLLLRYRTNRQSAYLKKLHELQRLQAMRRGELVAPPVALDVNIDTNGAGGDREL